MMLSASSMRNHYLRLLFGNILFFQVGTEVRFLAASPFPKPVVQFNAWTVSISGRFFGARKT